MKVAAQLNLTEAQAKSPNTKNTVHAAIGCLLGEQHGRTVDVQSSFEMQLDGSGAKGIDMDLLNNRIELCASAFFFPCIAYVRMGLGLQDGVSHRKIHNTNTRVRADREVHPGADVLGWYRTGSEVSEEDMNIHGTFLRLNASSAFLLYNPSVSGKENEEDVLSSLALYESRTWQFFRRHGIRPLYCEYVIVTLCMQKITRCMDVRALSLRCQSLILYHQRWKE